MDYIRTIVLIAMTTRCLAQPMTQSELGFGMQTNNSQSPIPLNGMLLWLKADTGVYTNTSGAVAGESNIVDEWADQSGNANNGYQYITSTNNAIFVTNIVNGKPSIEFYYMNGSANSIFTNSTLQTPTSMTIFMVVNLNTSSFSPSFGAGLPPTPYNQGFVLEYGAGGNGYAELQNNATAEYYANLTFSGWMYITIVMSTSPVLRLNGSPAIGTGSLTTLVSTSGYNIGQVLSAQLGTYYVPEYIEYSGIQSSNTIYTVESYLTNKYGL